ncbi:hypothetical protein BOTBODRAFT_29832 [Botryobasidium botryosum FD-172 SS1]|uniref:Cullin family profile domain-containing protein n=1 Tax=Botryobasidium botryosum (strain FD-172 SS1) TaxID=930990 RepID=A0A067N1J8_BOTB1|nr:hypothetical protein BOTBODRAFT_29832 [Botryobasidium botryosum FD-172 SS1]
MSMADLLTFPVTSTAFSQLKAPEAESSTDAYPRKSARRQHDADAPSSSSEGSKRDARGVNERGVKKLYVINQSPAQPLPAGYIDNLYRQLTQSVRILLSDSLDALPASLEDLFKGTDVLVRLANRGLDVHQSLQLELERTVGAIAKGLMEADKVDQVQWLDLLVQKWQWFDRRVNILRSILLHIDRVFIPQQKSETNLKPVRELAENIFRRNIFQEPFFSRKIQLGVAEWITRERTQKSTSAPIAQLVALTSTFRLYAGLFEKEYLKSTTTFFAEEGNKLAAEVAPDVFFDRCYTWITSEEERCQRNGIPQGSRAAIVHNTEQGLLGGRLDTVANAALALYLERRDDASIQKMMRMHGLYVHMDEVERLQAAFKHQIQTIVGKLVSVATKDTDMIPQLIEFKAYADRIVAEAFREEEREGGVEKDANRKFEYAVRDGFAKGFEKRKIKPAEMIAKYIDSAMRKGQREASDAAFHKDLTDALTLYRFTPDKDVFREFYTRALAKRLLMQRSASDDFEREVIKILREQYDHEFGKGDEMFKDLQLSRDLTADFHAKSEDEPDQKVSVMVLQHSSWPTYKQVPIDLPPTMQESLARFTAFYQKKHGNRKLDWFHALGTVTLRAHFPQGTKELSVSLFQAAVLLLFNDASEKKIGYRDIQQRTQLDEANLKLTLQSLACGKKRVLIKIPAGKDVDDSDQFAFNEKFEDKAINLHISSIQQRELPEETEETTKHINADRAHLLDAAIVRIMKAKKRLTDEELKAQTIVAVKAHFVPTVPSIKKQIESLHDRDFIMRDAKDTSVWHYVA